MKFDSKKIDTKDMHGETLVWSIWDEHEIKPTAINNLKFEGDDLEIVSFRLGPMEYMYFIALPLSAFMDNMNFPFWVQPGQNILIRFRKVVDTSAVIWLELEQ